MTTHPCWVVNTDREPIEVPGTSPLLKIVAATTRPRDATVKRVRLNDEGHSATIREPIHDTRNVRVQIMAMPK